MAQLVQEQQWCGGGVSVVVAWKKKKCKQHKYVNVARLFFSCKHLSSEEKAGNITLNCKMVDTIWEGCTSSLACASLMDFDYFIEHVCEGI